MDGSESTMLLTIQPAPPKGPEISVPISVTITDMIPMTSIRAKVFSQRPLTSLLLLDKLPMALVPSMRIEGIIKQNIMPNIIPGTISRTIPIPPTIPTINMAAKRVGILPSVKVKASPKLAVPVSIETEAIFTHTPQAMVPTIHVITHKMIMVSMNGTITEKNQFIITEGGAVVGGKLLVNMPTK